MSNGYATALRGHFRYLHSLNCHCAAVGRHAATRTRHRSRRICDLRRAHSASMGVRSKDTLLLQQETETSWRCSTAPALDSEWETVESNFKKENARTQLLQRLLAIDIPIGWCPVQKSKLTMHVWC